MRLFSLRSHFGNSLAFILFVWSISFEPFNLIIVKAPLYRVEQKYQILAVTF
jgi:hypothetical protein